MTAVEISLCHKGARRGTTVYTGGDTAAYMRNTGYVARSMDLTNLVPVGADLMIECARREGVLQVRCGGERGTD